MRRLAFIAPMLLLGCSDNGGSPDAKPQPDAYVRKGKLSFTWTLLDGTTPITCADVGAQQVAITEAPLAGGATGFDSFVCSAGSGETVTHTVGDYLVKVELSSTAGTLAEASFPNTVIRDNQVTPLTVTFDVARKGGFQFKPDADTTKPNCPLEPDGAGITAFKLELRDKSGTCVPTTFVIGGSADAGTGTPFVNDCTGDGIYAHCIENDTWVSVTGADSGEHQLSVIGLEGANECYPSLVNVPIPGGNLVRDLKNLQLVFDSKGGVCQVP